MEDDPKELLEGSTPVWLALRENTDGELRFVVKQAFLVWGGSRRQHLRDENGAEIHEATASAFATREHCEAHVARRLAHQRVEDARETLIFVARSAAERWGPTPWVPYDESDSNSITEAVKELDAATRALEEAERVFAAFAPHPRVLS